MHTQGMEMFDWKVPLVVDTETLPPLQVPSQGTCTWEDRETGRVLYKADWRLRDEIGKLVLWIFYEVPLGCGWKVVHEERLVIVRNGSRPYIRCPGKDHDDKMSRVTDRVFLMPHGIRCRRCVDGEAYSVSLFHDEVE